MPPPGIIAIPAKRRGTKGYEWQMGELILIKYTARIDMFNDRQLSVFHRSMQPVAQPAKDHLNRHCRDDQAGDTDERPGSGCAFQHVSDSPGAEHDQKIDEEGQGEGEEGDPFAITGGVGDGRGHGSGAGDEGGGQRYDGDVGVCIAGVLFVEAALTDGGEPDDEENDPSGHL